MSENNTIEESNTEQRPEQSYNDACNKVENILKAHFPEFMRFENGKFTILRGSTQVMISIHYLIQNETVIICTANVVRKAKINSETMHFLLRKNSQIQFGAFGLLFDGTITFSHSITGSNLDSNELITTLNSVAYMADYYDDIIVQMAGGKRAKDFG
ncbi:YbjN domain-containing protein [Bacteroidota bacterium]